MILITETLSHSDFRHSLKSRTALKTHNGTELNPKPTEGNVSAAESFVRERLSERGTRNDGEAGRRKRVNGDR